MSKIVLVIKRCLKIIKSIIRRVTNLHRAILISNNPSYYPEKERKSKCKRIWDNLLWLIKYGEVNNFYTLYGCDLKENKDINQYQDYIHFMLERNQKNQIGNLECQVNILRDKLTFFKFMKISNLPVANVFGVIKDGILYDVTFDRMEKEIIKEKGAFFIKDIDGECASFVKKVHSYKEFEEVFAAKKSGGFILQEELVQSSKMDVINKNAINTLRIVTIKKNNGSEPYILSTLLRVGTEITGNVDNWAAGGLAVGVNKDGMLGEFGFYKPIYGTKTSVHPDSKIKFSEFKVPMFEEACCLVCKAHKQLYGIRAIGWDVAITKDGPVIIEGNDNFEISLHQACEGPMRNAWKTAMCD